MHEGLQTLGIPRKTAASSRVAEIGSPESEGPLEVRFKQSNHVSRFQLDTVLCPFALLSVLHVDHRAGCAREHWHDRNHC